MQRVSIARALINEPALVLADEPTGNLDSKRTEDILRLLKEMNTENNQTFMVVTHDPMVVQTASKIIDILDGVVREIIHKSEFHCPYRTLVPHPGDPVAVS
jgi:putative ABC transport system ATP-binding protein